MSIPGSITTQITDGKNHVTTEFLAMSPEQWADKHMVLRYRQPALDTDGPDHFARRCWKMLCDEYAALRGWFTEEGVFSPLLHSRFLQMKLSGPIGDGIGWDFRPNGDPHPAMLQFKCQMICALRMIDLIPVDDRKSGNAQFATALGAIRSAHMARASIHSWRPQPHSGKEIPGAEMSRRWVSFQTFTYMMRAGADPNWAWQASRCLTEMGPVDEDRPAY